MQLAALKPTPKEAKKSSIVVKAKAAEKYATTDGPEKMEEFLEWYEIAQGHVSGEERIQVADRFVPVQPEHNLGEVAVFVNDDGGYGFKCFHNSCAENHWQEFKNHWNRFQGKKFFWQTNVVTAAPLDAKPTTEQCWSSGRYEHRTRSVDVALAQSDSFGQVNSLRRTPGVGKGMATMYIAACTSRGNGWHDCTNTNAPAEVVIVSSEDAAGDTLIRPSHGCGSGHVQDFHVGGVTAEKGDKEFTLDTDIPALRQLLEDDGHQSGHHRSDHESLRSTEG